MLIITIFSIILLIFYFFFLHKSTQYFIISDNLNSFYIIPQERGGKEIINQDKKGLHLSYNNDSSIQIINDPNLKYSIQIMTSDDFFLINDKMNQLLKDENSIFLLNDLFLTIFNNNLGIEYFLLYKNFNSREEAQKHCNKYVHFVKKCLIINVQNLD